MPKKVGGHGVGRKSYAKALTFLQFLLPLLLLLLRLLSYRCQHHPHDQDVKISCVLRSTRCQEMARRWPGDRWGMARRRQEAARKYRQRSPRLGEDRSYKSSSPTTIPWNTPDFAPPPWCSGPQRSGQISDYPGCPKRLPPPRRLSRGTLRKTRKKTAPRAPRPAP